MSGNQLTTLWLTAKTFAYRKLVENSGTAKVAIATSTNGIMEIIYAQETATSILVSAICLPVAVFDETVFSRHKMAALSLSTVTTVAMDTKKHVAKGKLMPSMFSKIVSNNNMLFR